MEVDCCNSYSFRDSAWHRISVTKKFSAVQRQNGANTHIPKRMSLQELFRPPTDLMFDGNWEAVGDLLILHDLHQNNSFRGVFLG